MTAEPLLHRKVNASLRILNPDGTPAAGQQVRVSQVSHQFLFGCGAFDTVAMMKTQDEEKKAFLGERMEKWLALFNYGTLPFYWGRFCEETQNRLCFLWVRGRDWYGRRPGGTADTSRQRRPSQSGRDLHPGTDASFPPPGSQGWDNTASDCSGQPAHRPARRRT